MTDLSGRGTDSLVAYYEDPLMLARDVILFARSMACFATSDAFHNTEDYNRSLDILGDFYREYERMSKPVLK